MIKKEKLDFWIKNSYNVMFKGLHGTGKSSIVIDAFDRNKLKWKYFSASTLDVWTDICGIPSPVKNTDGSSYIDFIRPKYFQDDDLEAIFFDEINRASKKTANAIMELIQFKSINGKKFKNLKIVWAAMNPDDDPNNEYSVDKMDPAQLDRFHVQVEVPYKLDIDYFNKKYAKDKVAGAVEWWNGLPEKERRAVSPRRLDYALDMIEKGGDIRDVIPHTANVAKLIQLMKYGGIDARIDQVIATKDNTAAKMLLHVENTYEMAEKYILASKERIDFFLPHFPAEKLTILMEKDSNILGKVFADRHNKPKYLEVINSVLQSKTNKKLCGKINRLITQEGESILKNHPAKDTISNNDVKYHVKKTDWTYTLVEAMSNPPTDTVTKSRVIHDLIEIPAKVNPSYLFSWIDVMNKCLDNTKSLTTSNSAALVKSVATVEEHVHSTYNTVVALDNYPNLKRLHEAALQVVGKPTTKLENLLGSFSTHDPGRKTPIVEKIIYDDGSTY